MSETYRNSTQFVYLDIFGGSTDAPPTAVSTSPSGAVRTLTVSGDTPPDGAAQRFVTVLGLADTQYAGEVKVVWNFTMEGQAASKTDYFDVVVPLVDIDDISDELDLPPEVTEAELIKAERRVRVMIENATGQQFAPVKQTLYATGSGDTSIRLPKRLISAENFSFAGLREGYPISTVGVRVSEDGFRLLGTGSRAPDVVVAHNRPIWDSGWPIVDPFTWGGKNWKSGMSVAITGTWGWERVPSDIREAALILIEQQLCPDSLYRERYLVSMTAADWRIQFDTAAYNGTGNVVADKILAKYQVSNMAVI